MPLYQATAGSKQQAQSPAPLSATPSRGASCATTARSVFHSDICRSTNDPAGRYCKATLWAATASSATNCSTASADAGNDERFIRFASWRLLGGGLINGIEDAA